MGPLQHIRTTVVRGCCHRMVDQRVGLQCELCLKCPGASQQRAMCRLMCCFKCYCYWNLWNAYFWDESYCIILSHESCSYHTYNIHTSCRLSLSLILLVIRSIWSTCIWAPAASLNFLGSQNGRIQNPQTPTNWGLKLVDLVKFEEKMPLGSLVTWRKKLHFLQVLRKKIL